MKYEKGFFVNNIYWLAILVILVTLIVLLSSKRWHKVQVKLNTMQDKWINYTPIRHLEHLSPVSRRRLTLVKRKTLVLDMDDTLIKSHFYYHRGRPSWKKRPRLEPDFRFYLRSCDATISVYKRPHVDHFLDCGAKWYNVMIFTAATENYASQVLDRLEAGRQIFQQRFYRHNCINVCGLLAKYVSICDSDPGNVLLLDDCHVANSFNVGNAVRIKPYKIGSRDEELLALLPFLDALRFTQDVRSVLGRVTRYDCLTTDLASVATQSVT